MADQPQRSPHGERGLKSDGIDADVGDLRSPHGERGLKYECYPHTSPRTLSLSSWRAWIEIVFRDNSEGYRRRSPHGERGLKCTQRCRGYVVSVALLMESVD